MATPQEIIATRAPNFATDPRVDSLVAEADTMLSDSAYGSNRNTALALMVCHWLALNIRDHDGSAPGGSISSEKTGGLSRAFSGGFFLGTNQSSLDPYLAQTSWGIALYNLQQSSIPLMYSRRI